ncbi:MAG: hypothetical protein AAF798_17895, partial [Bacteroidota bacterium]
KNTSSKMEKSKFITLLRTFSVKELKQFNAFVASPYFNTNEELGQFLGYINQFAPKFSDAGLEKAQVFRAVYPNMPYDKKQVDYHMNSLLKLAEQFLAIQGFQRDAIPFQSYTLKEFVERKLDKHYHYAYRKLDQLVTKKEARDINSYYDRYRLANIGTDHFISQKVRRNDVHLQLASDSLDQFYFLKKLQFSCEMLNRQAMLSGNYEMRFADEVKSFLESVEEQPPLIQIYLQIYGYFRTEEDTYFHALMGLIKAHSSKIARQELREIFLYAINLCARKIRRGQIEMIDTALTLYVDGIESEAIFENGYVSHWTYSNVVKLALLRERYDWIESFIHKYTDKVAPSARADALHYNLAELNYHKRDYGQVLDNLNQLHFTDWYYHLGSRVLLLKTYYELEEVEPLTSLLASFSVYLRRNKKVSQNMKKTCLNFCNILHKILRQPLEKIDGLREQVKNTPLLAERSWLLKVLDTGPSLG